MADQTPSRVPTGPALRALGERLRAVRENAGLSGAKLADALGKGWRQYKVSKVETGRQLPTADDIVAWAQATNADPEPLLALHSKASAEYGAWRNRIADVGGAAALQDEIAALEMSCEFLAEYQPAFIPGRLQIPTYMREMAAGDEFLTQDGIGPDELSRLIAAKVRRQSILYEPGRRIVHIVGEAALRTRVGHISPRTMYDQLSHLLDVSGVPGHELGVIPFDVATPVAPATGFVMYDRDLVVVEALVGDLQITDPNLVGRYSRWFDQMLDVAVTGEDAVALCQRIRDGIEG